MSFNFTFDEAQAQDFSPVPAGAYECFIVASKVDKSSQKGTDYIEMKLKIRADVNQPNGGRTVFHSLYFTDKTTGMVHGFLKSIGTPQGKSFEGLKDIASYVKGKAILAHVVVNKYEDNDGNPKENNKVKKVELSKIGGETDELEAATTTQSSGDTNPFAGQGNYTRVDDDPFANNGTTIDISDDDLPF